MPRRCTLASAVIDGHVVDPVVMKHAQLRMARNGESTGSAQVVQLHTQPQGFQQMLHKMSARPFLHRHS